MTDYRKCIIISGNLFIKILKYYYLFLVTLPWKERVKLSVEKLDEGIEETRRDLLIVGKVKIGNCCDLRNGER